MKVVVLATHFHKGGAEKQLGFVAKELAKNGAEVTYVSIAKQAIPSADGTGVRLVCLEVDSFRSLALFRRVFRCLSKERPDVVLSCVTPCDFLALLWTRFNRCKWVMREANTYVEDRKESRFALRRWLGCWADAVISNNLGGYEYWQHKRKNQATYLISNLTDVDSIHALAKDTKGAIDLQGTYFICIGRLEEQKNFIQALRGFARFTDKIPDFRLFIVGTGSQDEFLKSEAERLEIADQVVFTGYLQHPLPLLKGAEGLILPSRFEGCPNVAMEAAILNVPLILSDIPAHRAIFDDQAATYFTLDNHEETASAIEHSVKNPVPDFRKLIQNWSAAKNGKCYYDILRSKILT